MVSSIRHGAAGLLAGALALLAFAPSSVGADAEGPLPQPHPLLQSAPPPPPRAMAEQLAKDAGVSVDEATRRLKVQEQSNGLVQAAKDLLGDRYAGVWFDRETGDVRVGIVSEGDRQAVEALLGDRFAVGDAAAVRVESTRADLDAAQAKITGELERRKPGIAWTAVDDTHNRVVIGMGTDADDRDWDWARAQRAAFARGEVVAPALSFPPPSGSKPGPPTGESAARVVDVVLERLPGSAMAEADVCAGDDCSPPLRAAVAIADANWPTGGGKCSAGFIAYWWSGSTYVPFVMTAGHCMLGSANPWRAYDPSLGQSRTIGNQWAWRFGDVGTNPPWVRRDLGEIEIKWGSHWFSWIDGTMQMWGWPTGEWWPITGQDIMAPGRYGCRSGITTTYTCGNQEYQSVSVWVNAHGNVQLIENMYNIPTACSNPGDSGGPFVDGTTALGLVSAGSGCNTWFQHVFDMGYYFGIWAAT